MPEPLRWDSGYNWDDPRLTWDGMAPEESLTMPESKNTYSVETVLGFSTSVKSLLNTNKTAMIAKDEDPTARMTSIDTTAQSLTAENATQEKMKTDLREQTAKVEQLKAQLYSLSSAGCDKVLACFGRTSEQAKEATNLRKSLKTERRTPEPTPPPA